MNSDQAYPPLAHTGTAGLDDILADGLTRNRLYLVEGSPGTGKTTLAMSFLLEGLKAGEVGLYLTLSETAHELRDVAAAHGWSLDGMHLYEIVNADGLADEQAQTVFHTSEVELGETVKGIIAKIEETNPARVVIDSLSELRLLALNPLRYRRQILALKHYFASRQCTVLVLDDRSAAPGDLQLHSIAHGVISLTQSTAGFGRERRQLCVVKYRGVKYRGGYHDFIIERGGLRVFPRLVANEHHRPFSTDFQSTGVNELDALLGGGLVPGTSTLLSGPAGVGKTSTAVRCLYEALQKGQTAAYFLFDERLATLLARSQMLGMDLSPYIENSQLIVRQIDPAELSPGEFSGAVREVVEDLGASYVCIDSLNAYLKAMPDSDHLILQMHELLTYLGQQGVITLLILGFHGIVGELRVDVDLSYLSDTVVFMRYFESGGQVRKAISVVKTRVSNHERTIREFDVGSKGLVFGEPLRGFQGVLTGVPDFQGQKDMLLNAVSAPPRGK